MKQRIFNRVRTDLLETRMSYYLAQGKTEQYEAVLDIAKEIRAPIDMIKTIKKAIELRRLETFEVSDLVYLLNIEKENK